MVTDTKRCSRCEQVKPVADFCRAKVNKDGLSGQCKACRTEIQRERRQSDPDYAERQREVIRRRRAEGRRAPSEAMKPKRTPLRGSAEWHERRRWSSRVSSAKVHARRFGAKVNDLTLKDWIAVVEQHGRACAYCRTAGDLEIDHVVPLSGGGDNTRANIVPACSTCNAGKSVKSVSQFLGGRCRNDHLLIAENIYTFPSGKKVCRRCVRESGRRHLARKKAEKAEEVTWRRSS